MFCVCPLSISEIFKKIINWRYILNAHGFLIKKTFFLEAAKGKVPNLIIWES